MIKTRRNAKVAGLAPGTRRDALLGIPDCISPLVIAWGVGVIRCEKISLQVLINERSFTVRGTVCGHLENVAGSFIQSRKPDEPRWILINLLGVRPVLHGQRPGPRLI